LNSTCSNTQEVINVVQRCRSCLSGPRSINHRTTDETRRWAAAVLAGVPVDDLGGGTDDLKGYRSLIRGEPPEIRRFPYFAEEIAWVADWAKGLGAELSEGCLVTRTQARSRPLCGSLKPAAAVTTMGQLAFSSNT
jgi:hypothetical protein